MKVYIGIGQILAGTMLILSAGVMRLDGHIFMPVLAAAFGFKLLWDSVGRHDDDDDGNDGDSILVHG